MKINYFAAVAASLCAPTVYAQDNAATPVLVAMPVVQAPAMVLPSNTKISLRMNEDLTSKTAREGTMFGLSVAEDVRVGDYVVIPRGSRGTGEVTWRTGKGAFGKSAKMTVELRHIEMGGRRVPITGSYRQEGEGNTVATVGGVIAAGVFAAFITGKSALIPEGRELVAYTKDELPFAVSATVQQPVAIPTVLQSALAPVATIQPVAAVQATTAN